MTCNPLALSRALDDDLSLQEGEELLAHLGGCEKCRDHLRELRKTNDAIQESIRYVDGQATRERIWDELQRQGLVGRRRRSN